MITKKWTGVVMNNPVLMLFKLAFAGLFLFMVVFIMKLEIGDYDSFSYLSMANYNAGFPYFEDPQINTRPPLYPFLLTPITALQHLGVSPKVVLLMAHLIALLFSFSFIAACYLLLKSLLSQELAALGALLMMIQPGFLDYSFEPMVDLPCSLLLVFAVLIYFQYRSCPNRKNLLLLCFVIGMGMAMKYSLIVAPLIFSLAEIVVLRAHGKISWLKIFKNRFIYLVPMLSAGFYFLASLISFAPKFGWTWKNVAMVYSPFIQRIYYSERSDFQFDFWANFSFLGIQMTWPWFVLMVLGLYFCLKEKELKSLVICSWFFGFLVFITFINWNYQVRFLFPVMPACYYFSLYAIRNIHRRAQKWLEGKSYFSSLRAVIFIALLSLPVMCLAGEVQSLSADLYRNNISTRVAMKVNEISSEEDRVWWLGHFYPLYQPGEPIHPQDWFYKIYHLGNNALSFLIAKKIWHIPEYAPYKYSQYLKNGDLLIYNPGPIVYSQYLPEPDSLPPLLAGKVNPSVHILKKSIGKFKNFQTQDSVSQVSLTSVNDDHIVVEMNENSNPDLVNILWFKLDNRIVESRRAQKNFFYFWAKQEMVLPLGRNYFKQIQEITLLRYQAEEFR